MHGFYKVAGGSAKRSRGWTGNCRGGKVAGKIVGKLMENSRKIIGKKKMQEIGHIEICSIHS